jgi:hypothetical protein
MRLLDQQLTTNELEPPMRSVDGWPVNVQLREPAALHELTPDSANNGENTPLPPPKTYALVRHDAF